MGDFQSMFLFLCKNFPALNVEDLTAKEMYFYYAHEVNLQAHTNPEIEPKTGKQKKPIYPFKWHKT